jgi:hypothetical protein
MLLFPHVVYSAVRYLVFFSFVPQVIVTNTISGHTWDTVDADVDMDAVAESDVWRQPLFGMLYPPTYTVNT